MDEGIVPLISGCLKLMTLKARSTLARLHANGNIDDPFVQAQLEDMKVEIGKSQAIGEATYAFLA